MATVLAITDIVIGGKYRCASKNDPSVKFKVSADSVDKKAKKVTVTGLDGTQEGKTMTVSIERLSRTQGRQAGFSPVAKTEKPSVKEKAKSTTTAAKPKAKKAETEEMSLKSAKAEVLDLSELMKDLSQRLDALHTFLEGYKEEEEEAEEEEDTDESEEEAEKPAPKKKPATKKKPMVDEDD